MVAVGLHMPQRFEGAKPCIWSESSNACGQARKLCQDIGKGWAINHALSRFVRPALFVSIACAGTGYRTACARCETGAVISMTKLQWPHLFSQYCTQALEHASMERGTYRTSDRSECELIVHIYQAETGQR